MKLPVVALSPRESGVGSDSDASLSLLILLPGMILFVWGWEYLKPLALPLAYLQFMIPWMDEFINRLHWFFQILSADLGVWLLKSLGFAVHQDGKYIMLPRITLEVAEGCSGVQFLTSVIALGIPLVYLTQRTWCRAAGVLASGVGITVLTNGVRVALVGIMAYYYGAEMLHGPVHVFQAWFVAQFGFIGLLLINWAVCKVPSRSEVKLYNRWTTHHHECRDFPGKTYFLSRPVAMVLIFLIGLGVSLRLFATPRPFPPKRALSEFPYIVGNWQGGRSTWLKGDRLFAGVDAELTRTFQDKSGREVHLYVGYFESQRQGKSLINYRANPLYERLREVPTGFGDLGPKTVNLAAPTIGQTRYAALFWYRFPSGTTTGRYQTKLRGITDGLIHGRNNGAVILVAAPLSNIGNEAPVSADLMAFAGAVAPALHKYLP